MFWLTEASVSSNNLSAVETYEHVDSASSPTSLQLMGGGRKLGEPSRYSPDIPKPAAPEDLGAGAALSGTPTSVPRITKSHSTLPTSSPSWGVVPTTSTSMAPWKAPPAPDTPSTSATAGRSKPEVTTTRSLALTVDDAIKGRHRVLSGAPQTDERPGPMRRDFCHDGTTF
jgi:hypothetical protein